MLTEMYCISLVNTYRLAQKKIATPTLMPTNCGAAVIVEVLDYSVPPCL